MKIRYTVLFVGLATLAMAQEPIKTPPIVLQPGDTLVFAHAPAGFDTRRENVPQGKTDTIHYFSKSVGNQRKMLVYTPPGYNPAKTYPVLYLMHGIGGDEMEWHKYTDPSAILDNLYADGKIVPMIVVFPNGRAQPDDRPVGNIYASAPAFALFEKDFFSGIIPYMETNYKVRKDAGGRAIAGYSMGGGQSLNIGLSHLDSVAWIGSFSAAPNTKKPAELMPDPAMTAKKLKLLFITCGNQDGLIFISQEMDNYLKQNKVPHIWQVEPGNHSMTVWSNDLYLFLQRVFREKR